MTDRTRLDHLSSCYGIALEYTDIWGRSHPISETTQRALLAAMGVPAGTEADLECALADTAKKKVLPRFEPCRKKQRKKESKEKGARLDALAFESMHTV